MSNPLRVLVATTVPVGPRALTLAGDGGQRFALHVTVGVDGVDGAPAGADVLPWNLWPDAQGATPAVKPAILVRARSGAKKATFKTTLIDAEATPLVPARALVRGWFPLDQLDGSASALMSDKPFLRDRLAYAATLPGEIPQVLKVVWYFKINATAESGSEFTGADDIDLFVAAPSVPGYTPKTDYAAGSKDDWTYDAQAGATGAPFVARVKAVAKKQPDPASHLVFDDEPIADRAPGLNFGDYWLRSHQTSTWSEQLFERCLAVTNPLARLADFARWLVEDPHAPKLDGAAYQALWRFLGSAPAAYLVPDVELFKRVSADVKAKVPLFAPEWITSTDDQHPGAWTRIAPRAGETKEQRDGREQRWRKMLADALGLGALADDSLVNADPQLVDATLDVIWSEAIALNMPGVDPLASIPTGERRTVFRMNAQPDPRGVKENDAAPAYRHRATATERQLKIVGALQANAAPSPYDAAINETTNWLKDLPRTLVASGPLQLVAAGGWPDALHQAWLQYTNAFASSFWGDWPKTRGPFAAGAKTEHAPSGLTLQFDAPQLRDATIAPTDDADPWRRVAGIGLLVRKKDDKWRFADAGVMRTPGTPETPDGTPLFKDDAPVLVPVRVPHRDGVRYPFVTYNQRSLVAVNPLVRDYAKNYAWQGENKRTSALFNYQPVLGKDADAMRLTRLVFGQRYELAAFMIDIAGGLPKALTKGEPWQLDPALRKEAPLADAHGSLIPDSAKVELDYRRQVPIGHARLRALDRGRKPMTPIDWPTLPADVVPLAREVEDPNGPLDAAGNRIDPTLVPVDGSHGPFVLHAEQTTLVIGVKPPTVDVEVLERSNANVEDVRVLRKAHRDRIASGAATTRLENDLAFDDPTVVGHAIHLEQFVFGSGWKSVGWARAPLGPSPTPFAGADWLPIECRYDEPAGWTIAWSAATASVSVTIAPTNNANVGRLSIHPLLTDVSQFPVDFFKDVAVPLNDPQFGGYTALPPLTVLLEAATTSLVEPEVLWSDLSVVENGRGFALSVQAQAALAKYRNIARAELLKQTWRWQGRQLDAPKGGWPVAPSALPPSQDVVEWETGAFAELDDQLDTMVIPIGYPKLVPQGADGCTIELRKESFADEPRATYVRYALRVYSRYAPLFKRTPIAPVTTRMTLTVTDARGNTKQRRVPGVGWRRAFVPYGGAPPSKPPPLRGFVPLTLPYSEHGAADAAAPILAVLDEPAFHVCGISETIECRVVNANSVDSSKKVLEYGPDPTLSTERWDAAKSDEVLLAALGPFGYTFDSVDARNPLFVASAWMLRPLDGGRPWDFARVRVRRRSGCDAIDQKTGEEAWTKPTWIQFLPPATFGCNWNDVRANWQSAGGALLHLPAGAIATFYPPVLAPFQYRLLVTRQITDFRGDPYHEAQPTIATPALPKTPSAGVDLSFSIPGAARDATWFVRVVEIHSVLAPDGKPVPLPNDAAAFWAALFPPLADPTRDSEVADAADARFRVTRVSPPVTIR